jgi:uncharacterized protein YndB with AHSA1/START domain/ketosteroid isomerase-like protein
MDRSDNLEVARAVYAAYEKKDRAAIERLIAKDFHFISPLDNRLDRATYFERCWPNSESIKGFDFVNLVPEGDRVFVTYEGHNVKGTSFRNTEILTVREGQLVEAEVYFGWSIPHKAERGSFVTEEPQQLSQAPIAKTGMLIRRPVAKVFEAFIDPEITTKFWFTKSSGRLEVGKEVKWDWEMYGHSTKVTPKLVEPNKRIVMEWQGYTGPTTVEWKFASLLDDTTFVSVSESGWTGAADDPPRKA